jgi:hypothetical protein
MAGSPLDCIAERLRNALEIASNANSHGTMSKEELMRLSHYILEIIKPLPKVYNDRFWFDAGLIRAMSVDWSDDKLFSTIIIPSYNEQWGYTRLPMPLSEASHSRNPPSSHILQIVFLPRADDLAQVALLEYPWIAHELAHSLRFWHDSILIPLIGPIVTTAFQKRRLAAIAVSKLDSIDVYRPGKIPDV